MRSSSTGSSALPGAARRRAKSSEELLARVGDLVESEGRLMPGALRALDLTSEHGPVALASSTPVALIERCLRHFELADRFASIHSAQFEPYGKPHPAVFLSAASSLGVRPDSLSGLRGFVGRRARGQGGQHVRRRGAHARGPRGPRLRRSPTSSSTRSKSCRPGGWTSSSSRASW